MNKEETLMDYVKQEILRGRGGNLTVDEDLLSAGIIDSLGILQMVSFIEERFNLQVPDEGVVYENFNNIKSLAAYLNTLG